MATRYPFTSRGQSAGKPTVTIPHSQYVQMKRQFLAIQNIHLTSYEKDIKIKRLKERCKSAENCAIQSEIRLAEVLLQLAFDSPKVATSLLLVTSTVKPSKRVEASVKILPEIQSSNLNNDEHNAKVTAAKLSTELDENVSTDSPSDSSFVTVVPRSESANVGDIMVKDLPVPKKEEMVVNIMPGVSKVIFDKLVQELSKTKKRLYSILQEKDRIQTEEALPYLDMQEYEEVIAQLRQELLVLRYQYHQLRGVVHDQQGGDMDDLVSTITGLQDKVRKQEKQIHHQHNLFDGLQSKYNDLKNRLPSNDSEENPTELGCTQTGDDSSHEPNSHEEKTSSQKSSEEIDSLRLELKELRNTNSMLRSKCKVLVEQHEQTLDLLKTIQEQGPPDVKRLHKEAVEELWAVRGDLKSAGKQIDKLTQENEWCKDMFLNIKEAMTTQEIKHREERSEFSRQKALYEKNLQFLSQCYQNTRKQMMQMESENKLFKTICDKLKSQAPPVRLATSCAREMMQSTYTLTDSRVLVESDLQTDGAENLDIPEPSNSKSTEVEAYLDSPVIKCRHCQKELDSKEALLAHEEHCDMKTNL